MNNKWLRSTIFRHLDGIVLAPIVSILNKKQIFDYLQNRNLVTLEEISKEFSANDGYLNVALRALASQGFLIYNIDNKTDTVHISKTEKFDILTEISAVYDKVMPFLEASTSHQFQNFELASFEDYTYLLDAHSSNFGLKKPTTELEKEVYEQVLKNLEGCIVGPIIVQLGMRGMFHKYFMESSFQAGEFHRNAPNFEKILDFLTTLNWFTKNNTNYTFTETGEYFARRATSYGVTVSYLPLLMHLEELIFGNPKKIREIKEQADEIHVDRKMNVWGSGGAHTTYFKTITEFIIAIFNQPIHLQPKGILDMGCGNGAFIQHIYETIERHTLRGKMLNDYPLFLVGADYNKAALEVTRANLIQNDIWAKVIWGDIGNPDLLAADLRENYGIELSDLLNMRTFLDHNRIWEDPKEKTSNISFSTGAFAFRGKRLSNNEVEQNLKEHFEKWLPYIKKNGLLLIELHSIAPELAANNIGETSATAYDVTHGFSDQYILELDVFEKVVSDLGLKNDSKLFKKFPNSDLATVSIHLLKV